MVCDLLRSGSGSIGIGGRLAEYATTVTNSILTRFSRQTMGYPLKSIELFKQQSFPGSRTCK